MDDVYRPVVATRPVHGHSDCGNTVFKRRHLSKEAWSWTGGCLCRTTIHYKDYTSGVSVSNGIEIVSTVDRDDGRLNFYYFTNRREKTELGTRTDEHVRVNQISATTATDWQTVNTYVHDGARAPSSPSDY